MKNKKTLIITIIVIALIVSIALTMLIINAQPKLGDQTANDPTDGLKPLVIQDSFLELYEQNSDIVGWVQVDNTVIDYPIMQTDDNTYYMDRDFDQDYSSNGSLFLDYRCDFTNMYRSAHQIVYGHNMSSGKMLQNLTFFLDEEFFAENKLITVNTLYGNYQFEIFSVYETPISYYYIKTDFRSKSEWLAFLEQIKDKSIHDSDIKMTEDDVVLTFSTCTNRHDNDYRFVVHAKLLNPEEYDTEYQYIYTD